MDLGAIDLAGVGLLGFDGDAGEDDARLKLHGRVALRAIGVVAVGRLGIDGDAGKDVARLRLHVRVDLRAIELAVVGRRCSRLDVMDLIGS